ncbi:MAG: PilZ domain-containing protein [Planctomycetota bacterium]
MFDELSEKQPLLDGDEAFAVLRDLERNTPSEIRRQRAHFRLAVRAGVVVQPGNASEMMKLRVQGVTGDVSEGGCSILSPIPLRVGDVYRLQFDRQLLNLPLTFARCVRCRLVREDAFEAGLAFFVSITLPEEMASASESSLVS